MDKLTHILVAGGRPEDAPVLLDKAVALARHFGARIDLLVTDAVQMRSFLSLCVAHKYEEVTMSSVYPGARTLEELILERAYSNKPDLVIKSPAPNERAPESLHESDWRLAAECPAPVLIVRQQPWAKPTRFAVAVDVADTDRVRLSRDMLHGAGFFALGVRGNLDILYSERERADEAVRMQRAVKVAQLVREFHVGCERIQMYSGAPQERLPPLIAARHYDVLVLGLAAEDDAAVEDAGAMARRLAAATRGDLVLLRGAVHTEARIAAWRQTSGREQRAHETK